MSRIGRPGICARRCTTHRSSAAKQAALSMARRQLASPVLKGFGIWGRRQGSRCATRLRRLQSDLNVAALDGQVEPRPLVLHEVQRHLARRSALPSDSVWPGNSYFWSDCSRAAPSQQSWCLAGPAVSMRACSWAGTGGIHIGSRINIHSGACWLSSGSASGACAPQGSPWPGGRR